MDSIAKARTHSLAFRRIMTTLILPMTIICSVTSRLWREMKSAVYLAKLDAQDEIETAREIWKR